MITRELRVDGSSQWKDRVVLAHGAGAPMDSAFMNEVTDRLGGYRIRVFRFEFPYMVARRATGKKRPPDPPARLLESYRAVIAQIGGPEQIVIGGKSMGGRIASMVADEVGVRGVACLGYPFHPPRRPQTLRTAHLETIQTDTLIVQGERDPFGTREEVAELSLSVRIEFAWMPDGDHSFLPRVRSGHTHASNLDACAAAIAAFFARF